MHGIQGLAEITQKTYHRGYADATTLDGTTYALEGTMARTALLGGTAGGLYAMREIYQHIQAAPLAGELLLYGGGALIGLFAAALVVPTVERYGPAIATGLAGMIGNATRMMFPPQNNEPGD